MGNWPFPSLLQGWSSCMNVFENAFHLYLIAHLGIYDVNVELLKHYHDLTLETKLLPTCSSKCF